MSTSTPTARQAAAVESGYALPVRLFQPHNPAFWVYCWFIVNGVFVYIQTLSEFRVSSGTLMIALVLQALYALPFVWFITRRDRYQREPAKLAFLGFLWGGLVSTYMMAANANDAILNLYAKTAGVDWTSRWGPALTAPFTEEIAKLTGIIIVVLLARQHIRSMYDGILLGMFVGLGFQIFENVAYMLNTAQANFNSNAVGDMLLIFGLRGVTGVGGHWLFTGLCGAGVGYYLAATNRSKPVRLLGAAAYIGTAMLAHGLFDAGNAIGALAMVYAVTVLFTAIVIAWKLANRRTRTWMRVLLADEVEAGTVTAEELEILAGAHRKRSTYLKGLKKTSGKQAAKRAVWVLDAQTDLAAAIAATDDPASPDASAARAEVVRLKALPVS